MRFLIKYLALFALISLLFSSCSKDETTDIATEVSEDAASIYFGPLLADLNNQLNRQQEQDIPECSGDDPVYAQIKLTYGNDNTPVEVIVEILEDDQGLFTAYDEALEIPIPSGETTVSVSLNEFIVWNEIDDAPGIPIWVAPKSGSEYAKFVSDPLSNVFSLRAGSKNYINVDVICYDDRDVNLYGYQFFDINPVPLYDLCVFANYCTDAGRHYTANYNLSLYEYDAEAEDGKGQMIYANETPQIGNDEGTYWADPLCVVIPGSDVASNLPYLVIEVSLLDWEGNYMAEEDDESTITVELSWNMINSLLSNDGVSSEYWHFFFNCPESDGPGECDFEDPEADCDADGTINGEDNCPNISNRDQADLDGDDVGDACDDDRDGDGTDNESDPCPDDPNDACVDECANSGGDSDGDGICDDDDNCPNDANPGQEDLDGDDVGDACDDDRDGDGTDNESDPCPDDPNDACVDECADSGGDSDGDGICNDDDNCPNENPDLDYDMDGCEDIPDSCEFITDNDCSFLIWDQTTASGGNPIYGIDLDNENIGSVEIQINGDSDVEIDFNLDIDYLLDDIYIVLDDGTTRCASNLGQGLNNFVFEGTFSEQQSILIYANVCPATAN